MLAVAGILLVCAAGSAQEIPVCTSPNDTETEVIVNGAFLGMAPAQLQLRVGQTYDVTFKRRGFGNATTTLHAQDTDKWVVLDVFSGVLAYAFDSETENWTFVEMAPAAVIAAER